MAIEQRLVCVLSSCVAPIWPVTAWGPTVGAGSGGTRTEPGDLSCQCRGDGCSQPVATLAY